MKRFGAVLALLLLAVLPVFSQVGPSRGDLIRADYGSGNHWVDVTQRVRSLVRGESLKFRVDNDTLGVDPQPGEVKTLRLQFRDRNGRAGRLTFVENQYVNVLVNEGGKYVGDGSGRLRILRADYGAGSRFSDVTARLQSQIQGDQLNLQVTNDTMGGDPALGQHKTLRLEYAYNGGRRQVVINEGDTLDLPDADATSASQTLRCESNDGGRNYCPADTRGGVRLTRQISGSACTQGSTWGYDSNQIWVDRGCRADFEVLPTNYASTSSTQTLRCESNEGGRNYCPADTRGGVRLTRQISGSACTQGSTWGYDSNQIWVDRGCRADFEVSSLPGVNANPIPYETYMTIPSGAELAIRTNETIDSAKSQVGQQFSAVMYADVLDSSGVVAIPKDSDVQLVIRSTAGSDLVLDIDSLVVAGQRYVVSTTDLQQKSRQGIGANRRTVEMVGGGAAVGAIIGAIVGGGKGAAIGGAVGAAGGAGAEVLTKGNEVRVPAETILNFKLDSDLRLETAR